jgi:hypothetical protein
MRIVLADFYEEQKQLQDFHVLAGTEKRTWGGFEEKQAIAKL